MKKYKKYVFLLLVVIAIILIGTFTYKYRSTYAKYVSDSVWDYYLKSKGFYISSDYLGSSTTSNANNLWDGSSVHFNLKNNLNQNVITKYDINYNVTCSITGDAAAYSECHLNGGSTNNQSGVLTSFQACNNTTGDQVDVSSFDETSCTAGGYTWAYQTATKDLYFDVVLTNNNYSLSDVVVNVVVTSTSPYVKTLSGNFTLHKNSDNNQSVSMNYENYSNYDRLIISNSYSINKCVSVSWDSSKLIIDSNNSEFSSNSTDSNGYINQIKFIINAKDSLSYIFYKKDTGVTYNVSEFSLSETEGC